MSVSVSETEEYEAVRIAEDHKNGPMRFNETNGTPNSVEGASRRRTKGRTEGNQRDEQDTRPGVERSDKTQSSHQKSLGKSTGGDLHSILPLEGSVDDPAPGVPTENKQPNIRWRRYVQHA